jgi:uncharacterized protein with GYD domain
MQGIKDVKARADAIKQALQDEGGRMIFYYLTFGQYDFVSVIEVPDAQAAARVLLTAGARGNVSTQTLQAFTEDGDLGAGGVAAVALSTTWLSRSRKTSSSSSSLRRSVTSAPMHGAGR